LEAWSSTRHEVFTARPSQEARWELRGSYCLFVGTLLSTIVAGVLRVLFSGGPPPPAVPLPPPPAMTAAVSYWLLLKVFASGCTADGRRRLQQRVKAFGEPTVKALSVLSLCYFPPCGALGRNLLPREDLWHPMGKRRILIVGMMILRMMIIRIMTLK
jgi:hypothetical protein